MTLRTVGFALLCVVVMGGVVAWVLKRRARAQWAERERARLRNQHL